MSRGRAASLVLLLACGAFSFGGSACGSGDGVAAQTSRRELAPQWQDVFDGVPEIYAVIRPQAIKRDAVYGALFKTLLRMGQARSAMRGTTTLEALDGAEEIVLGVRKDPDGEDAALVIRGVPASLDAARMTDAGGQPVLRLVDARAKVPEYQWIAQKSDPGSIFVLPDRTWVGAIGGAQTRARQAFASPFGRPVPKVDPQALATVRFDATVLLASGTLANSRMLAPLTKKLRALTVALLPAKGGLTASLQYEDDDASAWSEMYVKRMVDELASARPSLAFLKDARVGHEGNAVTLNVAIPPRLLEDLPKATGGDLSL